MGRREGGGGFWEGHPKISEFKGGPFEGGRSHAGICTSLRGALKGNLGWGVRVMHNFSDMILKKTNTLLI